MENRQTHLGPRRSKRGERSRIPRDEGQPAFLEALGMIIVIAVLVVAIGLAVVVPLAMALSDICASLKC